MRVLSLQSSVAYGYVGNRAAVFTLQRLGHEVVAIDTVHLAHHTGYGPAPGPRHSPADVASVVQGLADLGVLSTVDAVLSGYLGDPAMAEVLLEAVVEVKAANPGAIHCCDPVMGDAGGGFFVATELAETIRDVVVPHADVLTPNAFELEFLTGRTIVSEADAMVAATRLRDRVQATVLVTSVPASDAESVSTVVVADEGVWAVSTPLLPRSFPGAGDLTAAVFLAHLSSGPPEALRRTVSSVYAVLAATLSAGSGELALVAAQQAIASPPESAPARALT